MKRTLVVLWLAIGLAACRDAGPRSPTPPAGPPLADSPVAGIAFTSDRDGNDEIYRMAADGTAVVRLTDNPAIDASAAWSPDGRQLAFRSTRDGTSDLFLMGANGENPVNLLFDAPDSALDDFRPRYHPDGHSLLFYTDRLLRDEACAGHHMATRPLPSGGASAATGFAYREGSQEGYAWSPDGQRLVFSHRPCTGQARLYLLDEQGKSTPLTPAEWSASGPAWSPDGTRIAFHGTRDGNADIFVLDIATGTLTNLTSHPADDLAPAWSPDGSQIAFATNRDGNSEIYVMQADGSNLRNLTNNPARDYEPAWSGVR